MRLLSRENEVIVFHRRRSFRKEVDSGALRMLLFLEHSGKKKQTTFARRDYHRHSPRDSGDSQKRRLFSSFFFFPSECVSLRLARFDARHASALLSFCPFSPAFPRKLRLRDTCLDNEFLPLLFSNLYSRTTHSYLRYPIAKSVNVFVSQLSFQLRSLFFSRPPSFRSNEILPGKTHVQFSCAILLAFLPILRNGYLSHFRQ